LLSGETLDFLGLKQGAVNLDSARLSKKKKVVMWKDKEGLWIGREVVSRG